MSFVIEVVLVSQDLAVSGFGGRDEIEDPLNDKLNAAGLGEVTGGGSGSGVSIIDVELSDDAPLDQTLVLVRRVLRELRVPVSTILRTRKPDTTCKVYEE